jgi:hypothetical protein
MVKWIVVMIFILIVAFLWVGNQWEYTKQYHEIFWRESKIKLGDFYTVFGVYKEAGIVYEEVMSEYKLDDQTQGRIDAKMEQVRREQKRNEEYEQNRP